MSEQNGSYELRSSNESSERLRPVSHQEVIGGIDCNQAIDLFAAYIGNTLDPDVRPWFVKHIRGCNLCHEKLITLELYLHIKDIEDNGMSFDPS